MKKIVWLSLALTIILGLAPVHAETLPQMMVNFSNSYQQIWNFIIGFCQLAGVCLAILGIFSLPKAMEGRGQVTLKTPIWTFLSGILLYQIGSTIGTVADTFAMSGGGSLLTAGSGGSGSIGAWSASAITSVLGFVQILGLIASARGILIIKAVQTGESRDGMGRAVTHLIGGALAINIKWTVGMLAETFAPNMLGTLRSIGAA
jgi:hypothetical protein